MGKMWFYDVICINYHKYANEGFFSKNWNYHIVLHTSLDMRANFRGDRPFHGRDLRGEGGHNAPPPPGRSKTSNSLALLGLKAFIKHSHHLFRNLAGIMSNPVLFDTFNLRNSLKTNCSLICNNSKLFSRTPFLSLNSRIQDSRFKIQDLFISFHLHEKKKIIQEQ